MLSSPFGGATTVHDRTPYKGQAIAWSGEHLYVWGGVSENAESATGGVYHPASGVWSAIAANGAVPYRLNGHSAVWAEGKLLVWGGKDLAKNASNEGAIYDPETKTW